jgi:hypothetical protein
MTQDQAQALAVKTWGKNAIATVKTYADGVDHCFVSRTKYGLAMPYGFGQTFEQAFYNSQFGCTTGAAHDHDCQPCHFDGSTENRSKWPNEWQ